MHAFLLVSKPRGRASPKAGFHCGFPWEVRVNPLVILASHVYFPTKPEIPILRASFHFILPTYIYMNKQTLQLACPLRRWALKMSSPSR